jgi:hypothetical protein
MKHNPNATPSDPGYVWSQLAMMAYHHLIFDRVWSIAAAADLPPSDLPVPRVDVPALAGGGRPPSS